MSSSLVNLADRPTWLGSQLSKKPIDQLDWIFFLRFFVFFDRAFEGLLEFPDNGTIVFPDRKEFEKTMKVEYPGRCSKWGNMMESIRKTGFDDKKDKGDKNRVVLTHILEFGRGETNETFVENLGKLRKEVDEIRKKQEQQKAAKKRAAAIARGAQDTTGKKRRRMENTSTAAPSSAAVSVSGGNGLVAAPASAPGGGVMSAAVFQAQIAGMQTLLQQMQAQMAQMPAVITPPLLTPTGSSTSSNGSSSFLPPGQAPLPPPVPAMPLAENGAGLTQPTLQPHGSGGTDNGQPQSVQQQAGTGDYDGGNGGDGIGGGDGGIGGVFLGDDAAGTGANDPLLMMNGADGAGDGNAGDGGAGVNDLSAGPGLDDDGEWYDSQEAFASFLGDILPSDE